MAITSCSWRLCLFSYLKPLCSGALVLLFLPSIFPVLYSFCYWWLCFYHITALNLRIYLGRFFEEVTLEVEMIVVVNALNALYKPFFGKNVILLSQKGKFYLPLANNTIITGLRRRINWGRRMLRTLRFGGGNYCLHKLFRMDFKSLYIAICGLSLLYYANYIKNSIEIIYFFFSRVQLFQRCVCIKFVNKVVFFFCKLVVFIQRKE